MKAHLDKIEKKLDRLDEKLETVRINTATLRERVSTLEKNAESQKKFISTALLSGVGAVITLIFNWLSKGGGSI